MSNRYWLLAVALGGWLAFGPGGTSAKPLDHIDRSQPNNTDHQQGNAIIEKAAPPVIAEPRLETSLKNLVDEITRAHRQSENDPHDMDDLKAQQSMAESTDWIKVYTLLQLILASIGTGFLLWSLSLNRKATDAAMQAVGESVKANKIARETSKKQLRPYIFVESGTIDFTKRASPIVRLHFKNYGQTPAYDTKIWIHIWIENYPLNVKLPRPPADFPMGTWIFGPAARLGHTIERIPPIDTAIIKQIEAGSASIFVYGGITYNDSSGEAEEAEYRLFFSGQKCKGRAANLMPDSGGNSST